jgi:hypothetical protein
MAARRSEKSIILLKRNAAHALSEHAPRFIKLFY